MIFSSINSSKVTTLPWICTDGRTNGGGLSINPVISKDTDLPVTEFTVSYNNDSTNVLRIGGWSDSIWTPIGSYYYVKIFDNSENLIFDGIPCLRKSDNVAGLFDKVNNIFYTNQGSGSFTLGDYVYVAASTIVSDNSNHTLTAIWSENE